MGHFNAQGVGAPGSCGQPDPLPGCSFISDAGHANTNSDALPLLQCLNVLTKLGFRCILLIIQCPSENRQIGPRSRRVNNFTAGLWVIFRRWPRSYKTRLSTTQISGKLAIYGWALSIDTDSIGSRNTRRCHPGSSEADIRDPVSPLRIVVSANASRCAPLARE